MTPVRVVDTHRLSTVAHGYEREMVQFYNDLIAIPATSGHEGPVIERMRREIERAGFEEIRIDPLGNILGRIGSGKHVVMMDAHADTRGVGGARAGMAAMVYAGKLIHELGMYDDFTLWVVGSVQKEECSGLAWLYILKEDGIRPDCVLITEPTNLCIYRGERGRVEFRIRLRDNDGDAAGLAREVEGLNQRLPHDPILGAGSIAVTEIPGADAIHGERLLTMGETREGALDEVRALSGAEGAEIEIPVYDRPSYTGLRYPMEKYYPAWVLDESHPLVQAGIATYEALFELPPVIGKWTAGASGAGSMALMGVPAIGFGPGEEAMASNVGHMVKAAQFYAAFPMTFVETARRR
jgi:putative selenium metabolism hydrolase